MENPFLIFEQQLSELKDLQLQTLQALKDSNQDVAELLLSPREASKLFVPSISIATLNNYAAEGLIKKYYLGRLTFYKKSEIISALKSIKKYARKELNHL